MLQEDFDARLQAEIERRKAIGSDEPYSVIIECLGTTIVSQGIRSQALEQLKNEVKRLQRDVMEELERLGVDLSKTQQQALSNSISASLTLDQLTAESLLSKVKFIRLSTIDHVVLAKP